MQVTTGGADPANATPGCDSISSCAAARAGGGARRATTSRTRTSSPTTCLRTSSVGLPARPRGEYKDWGSRVADRSSRTAYLRGAPTARRSGAERLQLRRRPTSISRSLATRRSSKTSRPRSRARSRGKRGELHRLPRQQRKFGLGASGFRPDETTYNQDGLDDLSSSRSTGRSAASSSSSGDTRTKNGFSLEPRGGRDTQPYRDDSKCYHASIRVVSDFAPQTTRNQQQHVQGPPRPEVRIRLAQIERDVQSGWPARAFEPIAAAIRTSGARRSRLVAGSEGNYWNASSATR